MIEILGSSVAALVATERLMAAGVEVRRTPTGKPNGFAGHVLPDGRVVDIGFRNLELSYDPLDALLIARPFDEFVSGSQHGHRPWINVIADYVRGLIDVGPEIDRVVQRDRQYYVDPFLSGDPTSAIRILTGREFYDAAGKLERIVASGVRGFATFQEQALENCGEAIFRALIWPMLHKIAGWTDVDAAQHRKIWLPLWQPQSLLDALRGEPSYSPRRPMHFGCGALVDALERTTRSALGDPVHEWPAVGPDLYDVSTDPNRVVKHPASVPIGVAWVEDDHADGVEWLIDADVPVFRRTWRDNVCCVEYAAGANIDRWAYMCGFDALDKMEVRVLIGDVRCDDLRAVGYGNLNDQICQGLAAADRLMREKG